MIKGVFLHSDNQCKIAVLYLLIIGRFDTQFMSLDSGCKK